MAARADLFLGTYQRGPAAAPLLAEILARISERLAQGRVVEQPRTVSSGTFAPMLPLL